MVEQFRVGVITSTHGLKGEVKVFPTTDDPGRFRKLKKVTLDLGGEKRQLKVRKVSFFKQFVILGFEGLDTIEDVERLRGKDLLVDRKDAIALPEGRYFIADLIGLRVINEQDEEIGILQDVLETGANDVYVAVRPDGRELLLPVIDECVLETDPDAGYVRVHVMPGLEDL
ncbi:MAG: ribosome maturation factor RimM [Eubacterium sp.]|nr:ribosome maturation factor RimM [Eubacterium sp.]MBQ6363912.1 ribosome maturation factor RimM [Lachnospiraceae bacterium]